MSILIVYYSRTGNTQLLSNHLANELGADLEALHDGRDWISSWGTIQAALASVLGGNSRLAPLGKNLSDYQLILIGTPVWVGRPSVPIRTFIKMYRRQLPNVAFFCTQQGEGGKNVMNTMQSLARRVPVARLVMREGDLAGIHENTDADRFVDTIRTFTKDQITQPA